MPCSLLLKVYSMTSHAVEIAAKCIANFYRQSSLAKCGNALLCCRKSRTFALTYDTYQRIFCYLSPI